MPEPLRIFYGNPQPIISTLEIKSYKTEVIRCSIYSAILFGILTVFSIIVSLSEATKIPSLIITQFISFLQVLVGFWLFMKIRNIHTEYSETKFDKSTHGILETHRWNGTKLVPNDTE